MRIPISEYLRAVLTKSWFIILIALCGTMLGYAMYRLADTTYQSGASLVVITNEVSPDKSGVMDTTINTCVSVLNSSKYISTHAESLGILLSDKEKPVRGSATLREIQENLSVTRVNASYVISITFRNALPENAYHLTKLLSENAEAELKRVLTNATFSANLFSPASQPIRYDANKLSNNLIVGTVIGGIIGLGFVLIMRMADRKIYTARDIAENYDITVLGEV